MTMRLTSAQTQMFSGEELDEKQLDLSEIFQVLITGISDAPEDIKEARKVKQKLCSL